MQKGKEDGSSVGAKPTTQATGRSASCGTTEPDARLLTTNRRRRPRREAGERRALRGLRRPFASPPPPHGLRPTCEVTTGRAQLHGPEPVASTHREKRNSGASPQAPGRPERGSSRQAVRRRRERMLGAQRRPELPGTESRTEVTSTRAAVGATRRGERRLGSCGNLHGPVGALCGRRRRSAPFPPRKGKWGPYPGALARLQGHCSVFPDT